MNGKQFAIALAVMAITAAAGGFSAVGVFLDVAPAQADDSKVVQASRFDLVDAKGNRRAVLKINADGSPTFALYDPTGRSRVQLGANNDAGMVSLLDAKGTPRAVLAQTESNDRVTMIYSDRAGNERWLSALTKGGDGMLSFVGPKHGKWMTLLAGPEQASSLLLTDPKSKQRVTTFAGRGQAAYQLSDAAGQGGFLAAVLKDGRSVFGLSKAGKLRLRAMTKEDGRPELLFYDENRKTVWMAGK